MMIYLFSLYDCPEVLLDCPERPRSSAVQKPAQLLPIVVDPTEKILKLQVGEWLFVPGGWVGLTAVSSLGRPIIRLRL